MRLLTLAALQLQLNEWKVSKNELGQDAFHRTGYQGKASNADIQAYS